MEFERSRNGSGSRTARTRRTMRTLLMRCTRSVTAKQFPAQKRFWDCFVASLHLMTWSKKTVIASEAKQSHNQKRTWDCFVASLLAMTANVIHIQSEDTSLRECFAMTIGCHFHFERKACPSRMRRADKRSFVVSLLTNVRLIIMMALLLGTTSMFSQSQRTAPSVMFSFEGNRQLSSAQLQTVLAGAGLLYYRQGLGRLVDIALKTEYTNRGYFYYSMDSLSFRFSADSTEAQCLVVLREGPCVVTDSLQFTGSTAFPTSRLREECDLKPLMVFSEAGMQNDIHRLLSLYEQAGYPFASIEIGDITMAPVGDSLRAGTRLDITEGMKFYISEITVEGNTETNADVVLRETRIAKDELYNPDKVAEVRQRLERLQFFSSVAEPELYIRKGKGGLKLRVSEGNVNTFDGIIGYQPPASNQSGGTLTGLVNLSFRNLFGTGRRLDGRWERASSSVSELEIRYLEPWLFSFPMNILGSFNQRQQDSTYVRRNVEAKAIFLASSAFSLSGGVQSAAVIPSQGGGGSLVAKSSTLTGALELLIDTRDNIINPHTGIYLRNGYSGGKKSFDRIGTGERTNEFLQRIEVDLSWFQELLLRTIAALSVHGRQVSSSELDLSDFYRLGGANSLRGYREDQFLGTRLGWLNAEIHYSLGKKSYAFAFFDLGYVFQNADEAAHREQIAITRSGYGIGGRIETALGILGVSYALGQGDTFMTGKIHFGLVNDF